MLELVSSSPRTSLRPHLLAAAACALGVALPSVVRAGPPEALAAIALQPSAPGTFVLRYENVLGGLLVTNDGGRTVRILPGTSLTRSGLRGDVPPLVMLSDGTILVGGSDGLIKSDAQGCNTAALASNAQVPAIALHPGDSSVAFYLTAYGATGVRTGLWKRATNGLVTAVGPADTQGEPGSFSPTGLRVISLPSALEQLRVVETGTRSASAAPGARDAGVPEDGGLGASASDASADAGTLARTDTALLRFSDDLGQTWTERAIPSSFGPGTPRLLAIDPIDPRRMLVALDVDGRPNPPDTVLLTSDAGDTFVTYIEGIARVGQAVLAADGRFWLGDMGDTTEVTPSGGLWFAQRLGDPPQRLLRDVGITCVAHDPAREKLWLCQEYELDQLDLASGAMCRTFDMSDVVGLVACPNQELSQDQEVRDQLCSGYCGALHFADAPLCQVFDDTNVLCGPAALDYDQHIGWQSVIDAAAGGAGDGAAAADAGVTSGDAGDASLSPASGGLDAGLAAAQPHRQSGCAAGPGSTNSAATALLLSVMTLYWSALSRRRRPTAVRAP